MIPYSQGQELSIIHDQGVVETIDYQSDGTYIQGRIPPAIANRLEKYSVANLAVAVSEHNNNGSQKKSADGMDWDAIARGRHSQG
jgi:hypothetical protein